MSLADPGWKTLVQAHVESLISAAQNPRDAAAKVVDDLAGRDLLRPPIDSGEAFQGQVDWVVRFVRGGKIYVYQRTLDEMTRVLTERRDVGREKPYSVHAWTGHDWREVKVS